MLLTDAVPPEALLALHASMDNADHLLPTLVTSTIDNPEYAIEVVSVWAVANCGDGEPFEFGHVLTDPQRTHAANKIASEVSLAHIGAILLDTAARLLTVYPIVLLDDLPTQVETRLGRLVHSAAQDCSFDKRGDRFLWNLLRFALPSHIEAATFSAAPYAAISTTYGAAANALVGTWTGTMVSDLPLKIDYGDGAPHNLAVASGILAEHIDGHDMWVAVNGGMLRSAPVMAAFHSCGALPDTTGVFDGTTFYAAATKTPVASVLLKWAEVVGATALVNAITQPTTPHSKLSMMAGVI